MKDKEVLQKAIEIAIENGYDKLKNLEMIMTMDKYLDIAVNEPHALIFSHDFAKAFWGEGNLEGEVFEDNMWDSEFSNHYGVIYKGKSWQYHLQQMVLCDNPIDYLRKFIETGYIKGETKIVGQRNWKEDGTYEDKFIKSKYQEHGEKMEEECIKSFTNLNNSETDE
jgi:hypothetical protein